MTTEISVMYGNEKVKLCGSDIGRVYYNILDAYDPLPYQSKNKLYMYINFPVRFVKTASCRPMLSSFFMKIRYEI